MPCVGCARVTHRPLPGFAYRRSAWSQWRSRLQLRQDQGLMEEAALQHWALALQSRVSSQTSFHPCASASETVNMNCLTLQRVF